MDLKIFENPKFGEIRTAGTSEKPFFCLADVCKALELQVQNTKKRLNKDGVYSINLTDSLGREQQALFINEQNLYKTIFQSRKKEAEMFVDWITGDVLPTIRKTGTYSINEQRAKAESGEIDSRFLRQQIEVATFAMDSLRMNDASRLLVVSRICEPYNIALPDYVQSNGVIKSATELLKENNSTMSIYEFNRRMVEKGYLTVCERNSSKGVKKFKSLTEKGCEFGENCVSKYNINETQPEYYSDKFATLLSNL